MEDGKKDILEDWELSDGFYGSGEEKELSLEDFITESDLQAGDLELHDNSSELLKKTVEDVHQVMALALEGKTIEQIAGLTGLDKSYVYDIQVCAQGFHEDDEIAVAHLLLG